MNKPTILIGPEPSKNPLNSGSWKWFGIDLANELKQYYNIITQKNAEKLKKADLCIIIKSLHLLERAKYRKTIYIPVDKFRCVEEVKMCEKHGSLIILNNEELYSKYFKNHSSLSALFIPHHIKYFYNGYTYRPNGAIFWEGMHGNSKYVQDYLKENHISKDIKFLISGKDRDPNKDWFFLNYVQNFKYRVFYAWSEERHAAYLRTCSGFLDIKGDDFHQRYKPATKVLDAIASGVPTAINDCGVRDYMVSLDMTLAYPTDTAYWFSREYFDLTQQWKEIVRRDFHVSTVALQYKEVIDKLLYS